MSHIAIFLPSLQGGGAERVMVTVANGLAALGHRIDLVLTNVEGPYLGEVSPQVQLVNLNRSRVLTSLIPLVRWLRRERPEAMLSALSHANLMAITAKVLARSRTRAIVSERISLLSLGNGPQDWAMRRLMGWLYPKADGVIVLTQAGALEMIGGLGIDPAKLVVIPNPVDLAEHRALAAMRPDHPWLAPGQPPVILAAGRLEPQKDYPTLLKAFAALRAIRPARLVILGEGSQRQDIQRRVDALGVADDVFLAGFVSNPFGWMRASAAFVQSSRYEGFPNTLVQAMACGARVVSTNCPTGPAEILENGKWGKLVPVGAVEALTEALLITLDEANHPPNPGAVYARLMAYQPECILRSYEAILL